MVERAGIEAKLPFKVHPHMLRHATGFALANKGTDTRTLQAYLGHRSIQSTVRYTELAPGRFKNLVALSRGKNPLTGSGTRTRPPLMKAESPIYFFLYGQTCVSKFTK